MAQFDVHENPNARTKEAVPYLLVVQADLLDELSTRVVVPLFAATAFRTPARRLNPVFVVNELQVVMSTAEVAGIQNKALGDKVATLADRREEIIAALDFLLTGF